jgi:hypothetical protein
MQRAEKAHCCLPLRVPIQFEEIQAMPKAQAVL